MKRKTKFKLSLIIYLFSIIPALYLYHIRYIDPFIWWPLADATKGILTDNFHPEHTKLQPAYGFILYVLPAISGISPEKIAYYPIGGLILPIIFLGVISRLYSLLAKENLSNNNSQALLSVIFTITVLYYTFDVTISRGQYNIFAYFWTRAMFLVFFVGYYWIMLSNSSKGKLMLLIAPPYITLLFFHPTYSFWALVILIVFTIGSLISRKQDIIRQSSIIMMLALVIYLSVNKFFYTNLERIFLVRSSSKVVFYRFTVIISSFLGESKHTTSELILLPKPPTPLIGNLLFIRTILILAGILFIFIILLMQSIIIAKENVNYNFQKIYLCTILMYFSVLGTGIAHVVGYSLYGHASLRFVVFGYPFGILLGLGILQKFYPPTSKRISFIIALMISIIFISIVQFADYSHNSDINIIETERGLSPAIFLTDVVLNDSTVLSDFDTSQRYLVQFTKFGKIFKQRFYDLDIFKSVITPESKLPSYVNYVVVNLKIDYTYTVGWETYKPLNEYKPSISLHKQLNKIYDNDTIWIFHVSKR